MISKEQFIESCVKEAEIIKHLYSKITPEMLSYRPSEKQRTTLELLQYIAHFAKAEGTAIYLGKPLTNFQEAMGQAHKMNFEQFSSDIDAQTEELKKIFSKISDEELNEQFDLFGRGRSQTKATWFLELILKGFVAYKMQLFLYLKACGLEHLNTANLWRGEDPTK